MGMPKAHRMRSKDREEISMAIYDVVHKVASAALAEEAEGRKESAGALYGRAAVLLREAVALLPTKGDPKTVEEWREGIEAYEERANEWSAEKRTSSPLSPLDPNNPFRDSIEVPPPVRWEDVAVDRALVRLLECKVEVSMRFPQVCGGVGGTTRRTFLLHGPPGTGKTFAVKITAAAYNAGAERREREHPGHKEPRMQFVSVTSKDLTSRWFGESEKIIASLFDVVVHSRQPTLVFMDEIDALMANRGEEDGTMNRIKAMLLPQMDRLLGQPHVALFGATNMLRCIDPAFRRRFEHIIEVPMPSPDVRTRMLELGLRRIRANTGTPEAERAIVAHLVEHTADYSANDITMLVNALASAPMTAFQDATHFRSLDGPAGTGRLVPCAADTPGARAATFRDLLPGQVEPVSSVTVTMEDAQRVLAEYAAEGPRVMRAK